jgi:RNA recognition motif-containing protein
LSVLDWHTVIAAWQLLLPAGFAHQPNKQTHPMNPVRLFVGNLSYQTMEQDIQDYFSQAGSVTSVSLMFDKFTGKSRGFAFVELATAEEANKAVEMFNGKELQGRTLTVNVARPREERERQHGGGGGGYRGGRDQREGGRRERY